MLFYSCGEIVDKIKMPTPYISALAFGGPHLDKLFITTGTFTWDLDDGTPDNVNCKPPAGQLLMIDNFGVKGKTFRKACCVC